MLLFKLSCRALEMVKQLSLGIYLHLCFIQKHTIYESTDAWKNMFIQVDKNIFFFFYVMNED